MRDQTASAGEPLPRSPPPPRRVRATCASLTAHVGGRGGELRSAGARSAGDSEQRRRAKRCPRPAAAFLCLLEGDGVRGARRRRGAPTRARGEKNGESCVLFAPLHNRPLSIAPVTAPNCFPVTSLSLLSNPCSLTTAPSRPPAWPSPASTARGSTRPTRWRASWRWRPWRRTPWCCAWQQ